MSSPDACIHFTPDLITAAGEVTDRSVEKSLRSYLGALREFVVRGLTVLPRTS